VLLGPEWVTVGELLRYLAIYLPFALVAVSLSTVFNVIGVQSAYLFANLIRVAVIFASMLISINYGADLHGAFLAYIFSISSYQLFFIFFTMGLAKRMLR
jgi:hypothetical protein